MQKRFLLASIIILSCALCHAQVRKGSWLLGGSLGFSSTKDINFNSTGHVSSLIVSPETGWAISKNSVLGLYSGISRIMTKDNLGNKQSANSYQAGFFWRKFFPFNENEKTGWQTDLSAIYGQGKSSITDVASNTSADSRVKGFSTSLIPGFYFMPSRKIMLNAWMGGLVYNHQKYTFKSSNVKSSTFGVTLFSDFSFGVDFLLNDKR